MPRADRGALVLAALAGASAWISLGTLALTGAHGARVGALPPVWAAVVLVLAAVGLAWLVRLKTFQSWPLALSAILWAPWSPFRVPAALLVWEGPMETLVWVAAIGGVIAARGLPHRLEGHGRGTPRPSLPGVAPWIAGGLALSCSLAVAASLAERLPGGDEPHYLIITQSLLRDGDLKIQNNHERGDYLEYFSDGFPPDYLRRGVDGEIYSIHAPGLSVLVAPAFLLAGYAGAVVAVALICAAGVVWCWRAAFNLTKDTAAAWAATLAVAFSAPWFLHSFTIFPDPAGAAIVAVALALLVQLEIAPLEVGGRHIAAVGVALGVLPWLHTRFALIAAMAGLTIVARLFRRVDRWAVLTRFAAGPAVLAAGWFWSFWAIYGTPNPAASYGGSRQNAVAWMINGLTGLTFDQQFGLLNSAPVMVLIPYGLFRLWRAHPRLAIELVMIGVPYVAVVASFAMWWGGWSPPARLLVSVLPLAIPSLAYAWLNGGPATRSAFVALAVIGAANVAARVVVLDGALLYNVRDGYDVLLDWLSRTVNLPLALPSVHRTGWQMALLVGGIWLASGLVAFAALAAGLKSRPPRHAALAAGLPSTSLGTEKFCPQRHGRRGAQWALTGLACILVMAVAMSASWRVGHATPLTVESSEIDFIHRWRPDLRPIGVKWPPPGTVPLETALHDIELSSSVRARDTVAEHPLLAIARLPAGDYRVAIEGASPSAGLLTVSVGRTSQVVETWTVDGLPTGETGLVIRLPVEVHSVVVRGDDVALSHISRLTLRPVGVRSSAEHPGGLALRATRYGRVRVFALDDEIYMEPGGVWTRGNSSSKVVLTAQGDAWTEVDLQAGAVPVSVDLRAGDWSARSDLRAGERRRVRVPTGAVLTVGTIGVFRPVDYDRAGNRDNRPLGVRLEFANDSIGFAFRHCAFCLQAGVFQRPANISTRRRNTSP